MTQHPSPCKIPDPPSGRRGWPWFEEHTACAGQAPQSGVSPCISVVMPSFDQVEFIEAAIRSVLLQGYPNLELIVIDGGSADGTLETIRKYKSCLAYWVSEPDRGQSHAINKGITRCTGDIVFWLNSDDLALPGAFRTVVETFQAHPEARLVTGQALFIDGRSREIGKLRSRFSSWADFATKKCTIRQVSTFFERTLFDERGWLDESLEYCMDFDLLLRVTREAQPVVIDFEVSAYRKHPATKFDHNRIAGYKEADSLRLRHLAGTGLEGDYLASSVNQWLVASVSRGLSVKDRVACLKRALSMWRAQRAFGLSGRVPSLLGQ